MNTPADFHYPVFIDLTDKKVLLVGGGEVAFRKARTLFKSPCCLLVVAKQFSPPFVGWLKNNGIGHQERSYLDGEASGYFLIISATDDPHLNRKVFEDAKTSDRLINVVDQPQLCNIYIPALLQRDSLQVAISTNGKCPALARRLRLDLSKVIPERYGPLLDHLSVIREHVKRKISSPLERKQALEEILASPAVKSFLNGDDLLLKELLKEWEGAEPR